MYVPVRHVQSSFREYLWTAQKHDCQLFIRDSRKQSQGMNWQKSSRGWRRSVCCDLLSGGLCAARVSILSENGVGMPPAVAMSPATPWPILDSANPSTS